MTYGLLSTDLPLFLGGERLFLFDKKIAKANITDDYLAGGKVVPASRIFKQIKLANADQVITVFADYVTDSNYYRVWAGGGYGGIGSIPAVADIVMGSSITDNRLILRRDGWYLLTPNTPADKVDFYVYRQAQTAEATERYGLNIYDAKGKLQYHSGWNILRAHTIIEPKNPSVNNGEGWTNWQGIKLFKVRGGAQEMHIDDYMKYQAGYIHVGENKLVNIVYFQSFSFHSRDARSFWGQGKGYLAPFLHQGRLSLSLAHIESAGGTPDRFFGENQFPQNQMPLHIYNPILVIEKPRI